jgi:hypothetical protein
MLESGKWSKKNLFRKACENKEQFFSEKDCEIRIYKLGEKLNEKGLVPYKCEFCGWWHYGHEIGYEKKLGSEGGTE